MWRWDRCATLLTFSFSLPVLAAVYESFRETLALCGTAKKYYASRKCELIYLVFIGKIMIPLKNICIISLTKAVLDIGDTGAIAPSQGHLRVRVSFCLEGSNNLSPKAGM